MRPNADGLAVLESIFCSGLVFEAEAMHLPVWDLRANRRASSLRGGSVSSFASVVTTLALSRTGWEGISATVAEVVPTLLGDRLASGADAAVASMTGSGLGSNASWRRTASAGVSVCVAPTATAIKAKGASNSRNALRSSFE
jgi:hypothetical protein